MSLHTSIFHTHTERERGKVTRRGGDTWQPSCTHVATFDSYTHVADAHTSHVADAHTSHVAGLEAPQLDVQGAIGLMGWERPVLGVHVRVGDSCNKWAIHFNGTCLPLGVFYVHQCLHMSTYTYSYIRLYAHTYMCTWT